MKAIRALLDHTVLPKTAHEVVILVTGAAFRIDYELYAHERVASGTKLPDAKISAIVAGQRPADLTNAEAAAHDVADALLRGLGPDATWGR